MPEILNPENMTIARLLEGYHTGKFTVSQMMDQVHEAVSASPEHVWIQRLSREELQVYVDGLAAKDPGALPLYGIPFAIKDNIDLAGVPTTAACPDYAYLPEQSAFVVQRLIDAGAIPVGKTNLDQFATGLNGTRSPYGIPGNAINPEYIPGGSSSGSAVAVALGQVSFSLGTDTAGSGRVPAAFHGLVGLKPTRGVLSMTGVVPACRTLDTVSIFALNSQDAAAVFSVVAQNDPADPFGRSLKPHGVDFAALPSFRVGVPRADQLEFFGDAEYQRLFAEAVEKTTTLGANVIELDFQPFLDAARLLYEGPWVAERYRTAKDLLQSHPEALLPVTRTIISKGEHFTAAATFEALERLAVLKKTCDQVWSQVDCILTPTAGTIYTIEELLNDPIQLNTNLGHYTNFMNLLDYSAIALPAGFRTAGLPFGVTLFAPAHQDLPLLRLGHRWEGQVLPFSSSASQVEVAVCGAHLEGLPLNWQLTSRGGRLVRKTRSSAEYRFYALAGGPPYRPGMVRVAEGGVSVDMEIWSLPVEHFGSFVAGIPAPLGIGTVRLEDGGSVLGFVCESAGTIGATDISDLGSWRTYLKSPVK
ncbi:allophanate hydrolase [Deinococcus cellulosilyticus]|uniref:Allophanate hydrolase n=1 Tax=Deinococcus cellulosilyticus (strain DSM 18568 / NBRC 106333 / KACC 11606 / 5516J-15) TaxID=1223518 RepID=A0A511MW13_DEIC1|nr:allophanate hydrolase [Deinococcus cellulosilyticus]GEM44769.1 allophanate hydrolase [Deinococcus cellulosilyticus NBRC 106333 = KACC 11606]